MRSIADSYAAIGTRASGLVKIYCLIKDGTHREFILADARVPGCSIFFYSEGNDKNFGKLRLVCS